MKDRLLASKAALLAALAAAGFASSSPLAPAPAGPAAAHGGLPSPAAEVTWAELAEFPCRRHGTEVRFRIQFHGRPARWQAGPTRFGPGAFSAITAWSDEQFPWEEAAFEDPAVRAFVRRGTELERTLQVARPHQRFDVRGFVREVWLDRPWIELVAATALDEEIGEATVFHAARALERMADGSFVLADEALQQALAAPLPAHAREALGHLRTICAEQIAEPQPAPVRPRGR